MAARKVIIDCDPGIDDAVALSIALFDPGLEVIAVTATAGNVSADQASRNVQAIVEMLDPPRLPRVGVASPPEGSSGTDMRRLNGKDGLGEIGIVCSELHHQHASDKIIYDEVRATPDLLTIISLGPLTNIARAFQRDPSLASTVGRIFMMGGTINGIGNVTPAAEFNMYYDPMSARSVFRSPTTKTLVPLDITRRVSLSLDLVERLPTESSRAGAFLRQAVPFAFRAHRQELGVETLYLHDVVTLIAATNPELFETTEMAADVETRGELTTGATIFDRRIQPEWRPNMEVVTDVNVPAVIECICRGLALAGERT